MTENKFTQIEVGIEKIMKDLPHRYPFLLVDKLVVTEPFKKGIGYKNVTFNEPHFTGHFPGRPIMPGVLIIEAMAQAAAIMVMNSDPANSTSENKLVYFMSVDKVKFRKPVVPGDVLELHVEIIQSRGSVMKASGVGIVNNNIVTEAEFSAMFVDKKEAK